MLIWSGRKLFQLLSTICTYLSNFRNIILLDGSPFLPWLSLSTTMLLQWFISVREARELLPVLAISPVAAQQQMPAKTKNVWSSSELLQQLLPDFSRQEWPGSAGDGAARRHSRLSTTLHPVLAQQPVSSASWWLASLSWSLVRLWGGEWGAGIQRSEAQVCPVCKCLCSAICTPFWKNKNTLSWFGATVSGTSIDSISRTLWWCQPHASLWGTMQCWGKCIFSSLELQYNSFRQFYDSVWGFWAQH